MLKLVLLATSIDVERLFSRGRLTLSHIRNRLSVQTTRAILCLNSWSPMELVEDNDVLKVAQQEDIPEDQEESELEDGWDAIKWGN